MEQWWYAHGLHADALPGMLHPCAHLSSVCVVFLSLMQGDVWGAVEVCVASLVLADFAKVTLGSAPA